MQNPNSNINYFTDTYEFKASLKVCNLKLKMITINIVVLQSSSPRKVARQYMATLSSHQLPKDVINNLYEIQNIMNCLSDKFLHQVKVDTEQIILKSYILIGDKKQQQKTSIKLLKIVKPEIVQIKEKLFPLEKFKQVNSFRKQQECKLQTVSSFMNSIDYQNAENMRQIREQFIQNNQGTLNKENKEEDLKQVSLRLKNLQAKTQRIQGNIQVILNLLKDIKQQIKASPHQKKYPEQKQQVRKSIIHRSISREKSFYNRLSGNKSQSICTQQIYSKQRKIRPNICKQKGYQCLDGKKIKFKGKNSVWNKYLLKGNTFPSRQDQWISTKIKIIKTTNKKVLFGLIDLDSADFEGSAIFSQQQIAVLAYSVQNGRIFPLNLLAQLPQEYLVNEIIQMKVNTFQKKVIWSVNKKKAIEVSWNKLGVENYKFVPFVQMCHINDTIQWI